MKGIFGSLFDFNRDGKVDFIEQAAELAFLNELTSEDDENEDDDDLFGNDDDDF